MFRICRVLLLSLLVSFGAFAASTEFTYQGQLRDSSVPVTGTYDFQFALFDAQSAGAQVGATVAKSGVSVSNGLFTVMVDFGISPFDGSDRFLEIGVKAAGGASFTTLAPRQKLTPAPYAIGAQQAINATNAVNASNAANASFATTAGGAPPTGAASGDLSGAFPSPTIAGNAGNNVVNAINNAATTGAISDNRLSTIITAGKVADSALSANVTLTGNTFNIANKLVQLDGTGRLPAIDGSQLTGISAGTANAVTNTAGDSIITAINDLSTTLTINNVNTAATAGSVANTAGDSIVTAINDLSTTLTINNVNTAATAGSVTNTAGDSIVTAINDIATTLTINNVNTAATAGSVTNSAGSSIVTAINDLGTVGTIADNRLSVNVTTQGNTFNSPNKLVQLDGTSRLPNVDGSQLTNVNATTATTAGAVATSAGNSVVTAINDAATSSTINDNRLSVNVTTQGNTFNSPNKLVQLDGTSRLPNVDGSQLTNVNASTAGAVATSAGNSVVTAINDAATSGTINDNRLTTNVALKNVSNTFSSNNTFTSTTAPILIKPSATPGADTKLFDMQATGAGVTNFSVDSDGDMTATSVNTPFVRATAGSLQIEAVGGGAIPLFTNGFERVRINSAGSVGIGTSTPVNILDVEGGMAVGTGYSGTNAAPANGLIVEGNVGIGITNPTMALEVNGTVSASAFNGDGSSLTNISDMALSGNVALLGGRTGGQNFFGGTGPNENLILESTMDVTSGYILMANGTNTKVGVGVGVPSEKFHVGVTSSGGSAGLFTTNNAANASPALQAVTNGTAPAIRGTNTNNTSAPAGAFEINNVTNNAVALVATTNGPGAVIRAQALNASATGLIVQGASGQIANLQEWQNDVATTVASVKPDGSMAAFSLETGTVQKTNGALNLNATGSNPVIVSTNGSQRLQIDGTGNVGIGVTPAAARLKASANSAINGENAGQFEVNNVNSNVAALEVFTNSNQVGSAAINANHTGTSGDVAVFRSAGTPVAIIDKKGFGAFNGGVITKSQTLTLSNGTNADVNIDATSAGGFYKIVGPTGVFSIDGIQGGIDGRMITLYNSTAQNMTITDSGGSGNNIVSTLGGNLATTGAGSVTLMYLGAPDNRWIVISFNP